MSHADAAAAAPPVAPNTVKNRLRSIRASVVTQRAVTRDIVLHVTVDAPAHPERSELVHLGHRAHVAVARDAGVGPQRLDVALMRKRSEEHTSELQSRRELVCRLLLEKKKRAAGLVRQLL